MFWILSWLITIIFWMIVTVSVFALLFVFGWWLGYKLGILARIKESSARPVVRGGSLRKILFSKKGHKLDSKNKLVEDPTYKKHWYGGWRIVGIPFLDRVYAYDWSWVKVKQDKDKGGKTILVPRDEKGTDFILVGQVYFYGNDIRGEDVVDKNKIPVEASFALPAMIVNPEKALFDTTDWFGAFISSVEPAQRNYINSHSYDEIIADSEIDLGEEIYKDLVKQGVIQRLENEYGVKLLRIECRGIRLAGDYQDEQTKLWSAERDVERDRTKRLGSTTGTLFDMIADETKREDQKLIERRVEIQAEFAADPQKALVKYEGLIQINRSFIEQQIASDTGSLRRYYFNGGSGGMDLIALLGDVFSGSEKTNLGRDTSSSKKGGKKTKDMNSDELEKAWEEEFSDKL
jgi:hypothetical protein